MTDDFFSEVVEHNLRIQKTAREMNTRAGKAVFPVMSREEWEVWLAERLPGIASLTEVKDWNPLKLPELDSAVTQKIMADNPDTIEVLGKMMEVSYKNNWGKLICSSEISKDFLFSLQKRGVDTVQLPGGRVISLVCESLTASSVSELAEKLEGEEVEKNTSKIRREVETSWTNNPDEVVLLLSSLLSEIEIMQTRGGKTIQGFISLESESGPYFRLRLRLSREEAQKESQASLERLFREILKDSLVVPKEEPFQVSGFWSWQVTPVGKVFQEKMEEAVRESIFDLSAQNFAERVEGLKRTAEEVKKELLEKYENSKKSLVETESFEGEIKNLQGRDFVSSEAEEFSRALQEAKEAFVSGEYEACERLCKTAQETWQQIQSKIAKLQAQAERKEILLNFEAWHRRGGMTNNGDGWVIRKNGSIRESDRDDILRHKSDGNLFWDVVQEDELALIWSCSNMRDVSGASQFSVVKRPVGGLSEQQLEAVRRIESEIGAEPGAFRLEKKSEKNSAKEMDSLLTALNKKWGMF